MSENRTTYVMFLRSKTIYRNIQLNTHSQWWTKLNNEQVNDETIWCCCKNVIRWFFSSEVFHITSKICKLFKWKCTFFIRPQFLWIQTFLTYIVCCSVRCQVYSLGWFQVILLCVPIQEFLYIIINKSSTKHFRPFFALYFMSFSEFAWMENYYTFNEIRLFY